MFLFWLYLVVCTIANFLFLSNRLFPILDQRRQARTDLATNLNKSTLSYVIGASGAYEYLPELTYLNCRMLDFHGKMLTAYHAAVWAWYSIYTKHILPAPASQSFRSDESFNGITQTFVLHCLFCFFVIGLFLSSLAVFCQLSNTEGMPPQSFCIGFLIIVFAVWAIYEGHYCPACSASGLQAGAGSRQPEVNVAEPRSERIIGTGLSRARDTMVSETGPVSETVIDTDFSGVEKTDVVEVEGTIISDAAKELLE